MKIYEKRAKEGTFIRVPTDIRNYVYIDGYKAEMSYLYALIVDYYNAEMGYAFPSLYTLARDYGKAESTLCKHIEMLEKVELIQVKNNGLGRVNFYRPLTPLPKEELFHKFPKAAQNYEKINKQKARLAESDWGRLPKE